MDLKVLKVFKDEDIVRAEVSEKGRVSFLDYFTENLKAFGPIPDSLIQEHHISDTDVETPSYKFFIDNKELTDEQKVQIWNMSICRVKENGFDLPIEAFILNDGKDEDGESYKYHIENSVHWPMGLYDSFDEAINSVKENYLSKELYTTILKESESININKVILMDTVSKAIHAVQPKIAELPHISEANPATKYLFREIYDEGSPILFISNDSPIWGQLQMSKEEFERQVDEDIQRFHLDYRIDKDGVDFLYCCSPSLACAFSVDSEYKEYDPFQSSSISMSEEQFQALTDLSKALWKISTLCDERGESGYKFNNEILAGKLGSLWPMSIDEMAAEIDSVLESSVIEMLSKIKPKENLVR